MLSDSFDWPGDLFAAIPQRESGSVDRHELELVVLTIESDRETSTYLETLAAHHESRSVADLNRARWRQLGCQGLKGLPIAHGSGRLGGDRRRVGHRTLRGR